MRAICTAILALACVACGVFQSRRAESGIDVAFVGNDVLSDSDLEGALTRFRQDFEKSTRKKSAVDDAAWDLERYYQSQGFSAVRVDYRYEESGLPRPKAVFTVREGPRTELVLVEFEGNASIRDEELAPFFQREAVGLFEEGTRWYVRADVSAAAEDVADLYRTRGHLDVVVEPARVVFDASQSHATVRVKIEEGLRYLVASIEVAGGDPRVAAGDVEALKRGYLGRPYHERLSVEIQGKLEELYADSGFADARVERSRRVIASPGSIALEFHVESGPRVTIGEIRVDGNHATRAAFIQSRLEIETGRYYSREKERKSYAQMFKSGVFDRVAIRATKPADEPDDAESVTRPVEIEVQESPAIETFVEPGYGSYEGARLALGARHKNLLGTGRILDAHALVSEKAQSGTLSLIDPWLFGTDLISNVSVFANRRREPSFERLEEGAGCALSRRFSSTLEGLLGYQYRRSDVTNIEVLDPQAIDASEELDISEVLTTFAHDTRDNVFHPTRGTFAKAGVELGLAAIGSELDFVRFKAQDALFLPLTGSTVLGLSARAGIIEPLGSSDVIPLQERFYNGGENSVRSFRESQLGPKDSNGEPLGGEAFTVLSAELRQRLRGRFEGALFYDLGNVTQSYENFWAFEGYRSALGIGLRYALPVGPIRIDAAWNPDTRAGESHVTVHFSLGTAF